MPYKPDHYGQFKPVPPELAKMFKATYDNNTICEVDVTDDTEQDIKLVRSAGHRYARRRGLSWRFAVKDVDGRRVMTFKVRDKRAYNRREPTGE